MRPLFRRFPAIGALCLLGFLCTALLAAQHFRPHGTTFIVTNTNDNGPGSLRQVLADAVDGDIIQFDPALNGQTITLTSNELVIDKDITINGPGAELLTVGKSSTLAPPYYRIFHVIHPHAMT